MQLVVLAVRIHENIMLLDLGINLKTVNMALDLTPLYLKTVVLALNIHLKTVYMELE